MYGISTAWKSKIYNDGKELVRELIETGIPGVELEYRVTANMFQQMKEILKNGDIKVLSVHNYFPHPEILPQSQASGDSLFLSAVDTDERNIAIKYAIRSIQNAHDLEAKAVVFHLGKVDVEHDKEKWLHLYHSGGYHNPEGREFVESQLQFRIASKKKNFDAVLFSLDHLNEEAMKRNIMLGVENRYFWNEIPYFDEIELLLTKFEGSNIGYWHDCGHAQVWENLGLFPHENFMKKFSKHLIGIHLHDCNGNDDHIAPGFGKINFDMINHYLPDDCIKILEVHNKVSFDELKQGISYLKEKEIL